MISCCSHHSAASAAAAASRRGPTAVAAWQQGPPPGRPAALAPRPGHHQRLQRCNAAASDDDRGRMGGSEEASRLNKLLEVQPMTGGELRQLVFDKWGVSYDVRLQRRGKRMYLHVMWRFLEQQSFPLTEEEYDLQLDAVASYINMWQVQDTVRAGIRSASRRGPGYSGGGNARAISINLGVDVGATGRADEWNSF